MPVTYPPAAPTLSGDIETISRFLNSPTLIARRLRTLAEQRYIADALLTGRFQVSGGAVLYETGESIFTADNPRAVAPGAEYPLTTVPTGRLRSRRPSNGPGHEKVTDESIARRTSAGQQVDDQARQPEREVRRLRRPVGDRIRDHRHPGVIQHFHLVPTGTTAQNILTDVATAKASDPGAEPGL